jgi:phenylacetate-CoA ligase
MRQRFGLQGTISATGGSTGEPTPYLHDPAMLVATTATRHFVRLQFGWRPGLATVCVWGSERDIGKQRTLRNRLSSFLRNDWLVDGYSLSSNTVDAVLKQLRRHREIAVFGFTSMLEYVAREVVNRGMLSLPGRVRVAWNGGEMLFPQQSELFRRAFGVPILNLYGGREIGAMCYQTASGNPLWVLRPLVFVEIVDDAGKPVPPGEAGRLILTSTICRGTPFLRYDIGDVGCSAAEDYDEAGIRELRELHGRSAGLLRLPSGKVINCLYWNHFFKEFGEVQQFQVVVVKDRELLLRLKGTPWKEERDNQVRQLLQKFLGDIPIKIAWVEQIPLTIQGKLVQVIHEC